MPKFITCLAVSFALSLSVCRAQNVLDSILDVRPHAWWGAMVTEVSTGDTLFMRNVELSFMPASVTKLFTTAAALEQLGPDYRYVTRLYADGTQIAHTLHGDLVIRGAGDPSTGAPGPNRMDLFNAFADSLLALEIHEINGHLIGDDNVFDDIPLGADWSWEDLVYGYAAQVSGLTFHDAIVNVRVHPTRPGLPGRLSVTPELTNYFTLYNQSVTLPRGQPLEEGHTRAPNSNQITISSAVPLGYSDPEELAVHNPTLYFVHGLRTLLDSRGILVQGRSFDVDNLPAAPDYHGAHVVARHTSAPLSELAATINKESHNLYAEHVLKTLGFEYPDPDEDSDPGSTAMGVAAAMRTYSAANMDLTRMQLVDGSGLSRKNLVTPAMTMKLLRYMALHPDTSVRESFLTSLAVGGKDGTLEYRFTENAAGFGRVRAKTGSLGNVSSLAGYVTRQDGSMLAFVIFANHFQGRHSPIHAIQESFVNALVRHYN
jgi:D-alanyl-D-alanine carboxypeptidase/D-alanyl-D-alanine-endopeptidase (penicillin-binding protein 4)